MTTKKLISILFIANAGLSACGQNLKEAEVPAAVKSKFASLFPEAKNAGWEMEKGNYEAEFKNAGAETSAVFDARGTLLQTENEISVSDLPKGVSDYAEQNLGGKKIEEAAKIVDTSGAITFEAEIGNTDYLFDSSGNFLKTEDDDADDKDDNED